MFAGQLENWQDHFSGAVWEKAFSYLMSLDENSAEGKTELDGEKLFGIVMGYPTRTREEAKLETHNNFIDIQTSLLHVEGMDYFPRKDLQISEAYDSEFDRTFYHRPETPATIHLDNHPGQFVVFYPNDAHQCQLIVGNEIKHMKKAVVKVHVDLVR